MRTFIFGWNEQTWTYFLPAVEDLIASSGNILRCLLAIRTILPTPRVVVRPRRQDDQPNSDARTRVKLSTSACQCYHSRWSWGNVVSDQLLTIMPADKLKDGGGSNIGSNVFLAGVGRWWSRVWSCTAPPAGWEVDRRLRLNWIMNPPKERTRTNTQNIDAHQLSSRDTWATDKICC